MPMRTEIYHLRDDGRVPNNGTLPLVVYYDVFVDGETVDDVIARFARNGWSGAWVNGIFPYHHYHARSHEVLANLGVNVTVQFGGESGPILEFQPGAVVVIPAGVGHCRLSAGTELAIVGAYPRGQESWDLKRADNPEDYRHARSEIPNVALPHHDPVTGLDEPLLKNWRS